MTVTLGILTATTPSEAVERTRVFAYRLSSGQASGLEAVLADLTEARAFLLEPENSGAVVTARFPSA